MNPEPTWHHQIHAEGDRRTVMLSGEIDMSGAPRLQELLHAAVASANIVEVDVAAVTFIDSSAISALIIARNTAAATGRRLSLVNPSPRVHRTLDVTGVLHALM
ncbi:STAS domain-containing protein [Micromonospora aurantiaca (nom. illeg.)]|uniref:STAS domain-containing protein n=1 Tax=Micromonospora aurantiaca (nom. illeg.) TaxID=47850 RepID=UPI003F49C12C